MKKSTVVAILGGVVSVGALIASMKNDSERHETVYAQPTLDGDGGEIIDISEDEVSIVEEEA